MSIVKVSGDAGGTGTLTIAAPNTNTDYTLTLPQNTGTLISTKSAGTVLQVVNSQFSTVITTSTQIPLDNTIPQITEGGQFATLSITPLSTTSKLFIQLNYFCGVSAAAHVTTALFQDSTVNAIAAQVTYLQLAGENQQCNLNYFMTSGTTSLTTFTARIGMNAAGTITLNGGGGAAYYGGVGISSMTIMEIAA
jgi:hypothetical protein